MFAPTIRNLAAAEDILPSIMAWHRTGLKFAVITLVNIVGSSPRAVGSVMAVSSDGHSAGYLSGGCLEKAVVEEARMCIARGTNRLIRYSKDSPYFDIEIPCGSGIDVFIDQGIDIGLLTRLHMLSHQRQAVIHTTNLVTGSNDVQVTEDCDERTRLDCDIFRRVVRPALRVHLVGSGPSLAAVAHLLAAIGFGTEIACPDAATREDIHSIGLNCHALTDKAIERLQGDRWSAAILAFHEHDWEIPLLERLLDSDCFYIGVLGSKAVAERRVAELSQRGIAPYQLARLRAPVGLIKGAKSKLSFAVSVVAELVSAAKDHAIIE